MKSVQKGKRSLWHSCQICTKYKKKTLSIHLMLFVDVCFLYCYEAKLWIESFFLCSLRFCHMIVLSFWQCLTKSKGTCHTQTYCRHSICTSLHPDLYLAIQIRTSTFFLIIKPVLNFAVTLICPVHSRWWGRCFLLLQLKLSLNL